MDCAFHPITADSTWSTPVAPMIPTHHRKIMVFDVADGKLSKGRPFCDMAPGRSDGIRCDIHGNLWAASGFGGPETNGVQVFSPGGARVATIHLPEAVSNLCFGGLKRNRLFITGSQSIYSLYVEIPGHSILLKPFCVDSGLLAGLLPVSPPECHPAAAEMLAHSAPPPHLGREPSRPQKCEHEPCGRACLPRVR